MEYYHFKGKNVTLEILSEIADITEAYIWQHGQILPELDWHTFPLELVSQSQS